MEQKLNEMAQELALFQLNQLKRDNEIKARLDKLELPNPLVADLVNRVKVLEDARQKQIQLNQQFLKPVEKDESKKFWNFFRK